MHSVTFHEILFSFTFVWSLSIIFSLLLIRQGEKPSRPMFWAAIFSGPVMTLILLTTSFARAWGLDGDGYVEAEKRERSAAFLHRLGSLLRPGLAAALLFGLIGLALPKNGVPHAVIQVLHLAAAMFTWLVFFAFIFLHIRSYTSTAAALIALMLIAVITLSVLPWKSAFMVISVTAILSVEWAVRSWRVEHFTYYPSERRRNRDRLQTILTYLLAAGLAYCLFSGIVIFVHPGWSEKYFQILKGHSYFGYATWAIFLVYLFRHLRQYSGTGAAIYGLLLTALLTVSVLSLNNIFYKGPITNLLLILLIIWVGKQLSYRLEPLAGTPMSRAGTSLLVIAALTFATGAYIAEPFNSLLNNNMGLYVVYLHGTGPLLLLPLLTGLIVHHVWPNLSSRYRNWVRWGLAATTPLFIILFVVGSIYAHWKWFGLDAGPHFWPPPWVDRLYTNLREQRITYVTYTGPPPCPAEGAYPPEFAKTFQDYRVCGQPGCHPGLVEEWKGSTHRFAASNLFFRKVIERMQTELGGDTINYHCLNCHDPTLVLSPQRAQGLRAEQLADSNGINCKSCHLMCSGTRTKLPWDGRYEVRREDAYPVKFGEKDFLRQWQSYIRWDLRLHFRNYSIPNLTVSSELCASCHVAVMPTYVTGMEKDLKVSDLFTSWQKSAYNKKGESCATCHMPYRSRDERNFLYPDHRLPGLNIGITLMVDGDKERRHNALALEEYTKNLIEGKRGAWLDTLPFLDLAIETPERLPPGAPLPIKVRTTNSKVGHYFHAGPSSLNEVWLEVRVTDQAGQVLFHQGSLSERDGLVDPDAHRLGAKILGKDGQVIRDCSIWRMGRVESSRRINPFETVEDDYTVNFNGPVGGTLTIEARWNHRRASQAFVDWVYGGKGPAFPVVPIAAAVKQVQVGP